MVLIERIGKRGEGMNEFKLSGPYTPQARSTLIQPGTVEGGLIRELKNRHFGATGTGKIYDC